MAKKKKEEEVSVEVENETVNQGEESKEEEPTNTARSMAGPKPRYTDSMYNVKTIYGRWKLISQDQAKDPNVLKKLIPLHQKILKEGIAISQKRK